MTYEQEAHLNAAVNTDTTYQDILKACLLLEPEYIRICNMLPETDRELLERYISLCEELDHRRLTLDLTI